MKRTENKNEEIFEAAALKYDADSDDAPYIVAIGKGNLAEKMVEAAKESNVQVIKNEQLAHVLGKLNIGDEIPEEMYAVVAEILIFISSIDEEYRTRLGL